MTRYAVPVKSPDGLSSKVRDHLATAEYFVIIDAENDRITSSEILRFTPQSPEEQKKVDDFLVDKGVNVVIAGSLGPCMISKLFDRGIKIYTDAGGTAQDAFDAYLAGKLREVDRSKYL